LNLGIKQLVLYVKGNDHAGQRWRKAIQQPKKIAAIYHYKLKLVLLVEPLFDPSLELSRVNIAGLRWQRRCGGADEAGRPLELTPSLCCTSYGYRVYLG